MTSAASKITVSFIKASPPDTQSLDTDTELRELQQALRDARYGARFEVKIAPAAQIGDLLKRLREHAPDIVHFAGHGSQYGDLYFNAADGKSTQLLSAENLASTLHTYQSEADPPVRLVVLAGCDTAQAAEMVAQYVDCAVGNSGQIGDESIALAFTPGLYGALADGRSVQNAVESARDELRNRDFDVDADLVRLYPEDNELPAKLVLTSLPQRLDAASQETARSNERHLAYLHSLFGEENEWAKVSMSLFAPDEIRLARKIPLLDIFTPLPVDFAISMELKDKGEANWWSGALHSQETREVEPEWYEVVWSERAARSLPEQMREERKLRQRTWIDLDVDEAGLAPLVVLAREWAAGQKTGSQRDDSRLLWQAEASHAALVQPRFVLIGDPGSGKSTFLRHLALCWAGQLLKDAKEHIRPAGAALDALPGWKKAYTPIYVELRPLVNRFPSLPESDDQPLRLPGLKELRSHLRSTLPLTQDDDDALVDDLFILLREGRAALLLDGLDEVSEASVDGRQRQIQAFVASLVDEFEQAPILVTARPYAYQQEEWMVQGFGHTHLAELGPGRQAEFAQRLFSRLFRADRTRDAEQETGDFIAALDTIPDDLRSNPLLLTLLAALWIRDEAGERDLPSTRGELYRSAVKLLVRDWVTTKPKGKVLPLDELTWRIVLEQAAFNAQERRRSRDDPATVLEADIFSALRAVGKGKVADPLLNHLSEDAGILEAVPVMVETYDKQYKFLHLSFQEYLTACELLYRPEDARPKGLPLFEGRRFPDGLADRMIAAPTIWANVLRFAVDELIYRGRVSDACTLLARCCEPYRAEKTGLQPALLALQVALDAGLLERARSSGTADYRILCDDARAVLSDYERFTPEQRDIAGKLLGSDPYPGHDTRDGVGVRDGLPEIEWVEVPEINPETGKGDWTYQNKNHKPLETFWIARYPVTYAQFEAFLRAEDGFRIERWWEGLTFPDDHRDKPGAQGFEFWNHPRERVSWYDAMAFCNWLTAIANERPDLLPRGLDHGREWKITLPTEEQWEKAARGHEGRQYSWGKGYEEGRANIDETVGNIGSHYLQKTSAVGMYRHEAPDNSPYGLADLSGNVWEWCLNKYSNPERVQETGDKTRVLRGGSWGNDHDYAAASYRYGLNPDYRDYGFGFRVVVGFVPVS